MNKNHRSTQYLEGIKEGRELFNIWKRGGLDVKALLILHKEQTRSLRERLSSYPQHEIDFFEGEMDFFQHQLKQLELTMPTDRELLYSIALRLLQFRGELADLSDFEARTVVWDIVEHFDISDRFRQVALETIERLMRE
jgi:hypothetical protein